MVALVHGTASDKAVFAHRQKRFFEVGKDVMPMEAPWLLLLGLGLRFLRILEHAACHQSR